MNPQRFRRHLPVSIDWSKLPESYEYNPIRKAFEHEQPIYKFKLQHDKHMIINSKGKNYVVKEEWLTEFIPNNSYVEYLQQTQRYEPLNIGRQVGRDGMQSQILDLYRNWLERRLYEERAGAYLSKNLFETELEAIQRESQRF